MWAAEKLGLSDDGDTYICVCTCIIYNIYVHIPSFLIAHETSLNTYTYTYSHIHTYTYAHTHRYPHVFRIRVCEISPPMFYAV